jgi:hypothetical protein
MITIDRKALFFNTIITGLVSVATTTNFFAAVEVAQGQVSAQLPPPTTITPPTTTDNKQQTTTQQQT